MKKNIFYLMLLLLLGGCYKIPSEKGFLSSDLYLKGEDTLLLPLGGKGVTDVAWLDGSSQPCQFSIDNITDINGNRSDQFFKTYLYPTWTSPYDHFTDTTAALVNAKIKDLEMPCFSINPVNGSLQYFETTRNLVHPGDIYNVDVKVKNSHGEKIYKNYATLKLGAKSKPFEFFRGTTAIILLNNAGQKVFTLYDYISPSDVVRRQNIEDQNGKELINIYKKSDQPSTGVKVLIQYLDANGKVFPAQDYQTYASGTESYFDYAVNRVNTPEGAMVEFPITPWPVNPDLLSYLKGGTMGFDVLDTAALHKGVYQDHQYPYLNDWPDSSWGATKWFIRLRSQVEFYESGTWVISVKFPYTHL
jgi:hypothetical protein